jgi:hypothetical protein
VQDVKARSRQLTALVDTFTDACAAEVGAIQRVCVVDGAAKPGKLVAHNERYTQVCACVPTLPVVRVCNEQRRMHVRQFACLSGAMACCR